MACSKHRGTVINNNDPQQMGRLQVIVPGVVDAPAFAMPCVPYAGPGVGFVALPPVGANVWVEFENDDPALPIWTGCFWGAGEAPEDASDAPAKKVFKTDGVTLTLDDTPGAGFSIVIDGPAAGAKLLVSDTGITIENGAGAVITLVGPTVTINNGGAEVT